MNFHLVDIKAAVLKSAASLLVLGTSTLFAQNPIDVFKASDLKQKQAKLAAETKQKGAGFAGETLTKYGNHLTMLAHRESNGSSELHEKVADVLFITDGEATIITGGKMVGAKTTAPEELRGTGISGGKSQKLVAGDVIHIQPGIPHQMMIAKGQTVTYFVVKVTE
jgi:mannose-6-phosphate isomerase-like protein (cupin superfamily)